MSEQKNRNIQKDNRYIQKDYQPKNNRIFFIVIAVVLGVWAIVPDPVPFVIDDVAAGIGCAASIIKTVSLSR